MEFIDLTKEIYHGHEQEYTPIIAPLSLTDSNSSLPTIWRHHNRPSTTHTKPLPPAYPQKRNEKLDTTIRTQMNDFMKYSTNPYIESEETTSILTPFQTPSLNNRKSHCITIKRHIKNKNISNTKSYTNPNINNPFSRRSSTDKFVSINRLSYNTYIEISNDDAISPNIISRNAYLSNTTSMISDTKGCSISNYNDTSTYKSSENNEKQNNIKKRSVSNKNYINLSDIHINRDEYENDVDFYKNRDNIIKKYVTCGDKQKGTQNIIQIYLQRWKEEEMQNIPKIHYCFNNIQQPSRKKSIKKIKKKHSKKLSKNKISNSYDHNSHNNKKRKKRYKHKNPKKSISSNTTSKSYNPKLFMINSENINSKRSSIPKKIYGRNRSLDLIGDNHNHNRNRKYKINANTKSVNDTFGIHVNSNKHDRNQTMPYFTNNNYRKYNNNNNMAYNTQLSYSMSPSSKTASSLSNTFYNIIPQKQSKKINGFIPQPRASIIEKTFTWSDCNHVVPVKNIHITKPYIC